MYRKINGSITVFFSLLIGIMFSLLSSIFYTSIISGKRAVAEAITNSSINSIFAQYDRELLNKYNIFSVNTHEKNNDVAEGIKILFNEAFEENISLPKYTFFTQNMLKVNPPKISVIGCSILSDDRGAVFRQQVIDYMKPYLLIELGADYADKLLNKSKDYEYGQENDVMSELDTKSKNYDEAVKENEIQQDKKKKEEESTSNRESKKYDEKNKKSYYTFNTGNRRFLGSLNPIKNILNILKNGVLNMTWNKEISQNSLDLKSLPSHRELKKGVGIVNDLHYDTLLDNLIYYEYIVTRFHHALQKSNDTALKYEIEYLLCGKESDRDNLFDVAMMLFAIRGAMNYTHLLTSGPKQTMAMSFALTLSGAGAIPPLTEAIYAVLLIVWGLAETIVDMRDLFDGKKVPVIKTESNWKLGIGGLKEFAKGGKISGDRGKGSNDVGAIGYEDYLRIIFLLRFTLDSNITMRVLDLIEKNIEKSSKKSFFIDECIEWTSLELDFYFGQSRILYKREYGYIQ